MSLYRSLKTTQIRDGPDMKSDKVAVLEEGEVVRVLETVVNEARAPAARSSTRTRPCSGARARSLACARRGRPARA